MAYMGDTGGLRRTLVMARLTGLRSMYCCGPSISAVDCGLDPKWPLTCEGGVCVVCCVCVCVCVCVCIGMST